MEEPVDSVGLVVNNWIVDLARDYKKCPHQKEETSPPTIIRCRICRKSWPVRVKWIKV